jgi:hypothetical protein
MPALAFTLPILPGKTETDREVMRSCWEGERRADFQASRQRHGITTESAWIQHTPNGDVAVVYIEADDLGNGRDRYIRRPFDRWFRDYVRDVHGVSLEEPTPPPEQVLDYRA